MLQQLGPWVGDTETKRACQGPRSQSPAGFKPNPSVHPGLRRALEAGYAEYLQRQQPAPDALPCDSASAERHGHGLQDAPRVLALMRADAGGALRSICRQLQNFCMRVCGRRWCTTAGVLVQVQRCRQGPKCSYGLPQQRQQRALRPGSAHLHQPCAGAAGGCWCSSLRCVAGAAPHALRRCADREFRAARQGCAPPGRPAAAPVGSTSCSRSWSARSPALQRACERISGLPGAPTSLYVAEPRKMIGRFAGAGEGHMLRASLF